MLETDTGQVTLATGTTDRLLEDGVVLRGRFRLLHKIGEGGMSRVYRAIDLRKVEAAADDPHVAVKILTVPFANSLDAMKLLAREAHSLRDVTHPNIVRVIDCDRDGDTVFMTLELLSGKSLFDKLRPVQTTGMPRSVVQGIVKGIGQALDFVHAKNIVHGDLKPGNVIITDAGETKVIDFGLARLAELPLETPAQGAPITTSEFRALTPAYASPQSIDRLPPDPRDDVFSLACTTWMLMTGEHPFRGKSLTEALEEGIELQPVGKLTMREFRALRHALEFDRDKRTASAGQFVAEFIATGGGWVWRVLGVLVALTLVSLSILGYRAFRLTHQAVAAVTSPVASIQAAPRVLAPGTVFRDCPQCPQMTVLPAGEFLQGSPAEDVTGLPYERPRHRVSLARSLAIGVYDVTVGEYAQFAAAGVEFSGGCAIYGNGWQLSAATTWRNAAESQTLQHPATCVSWEDARRYAAWLSQRTGHTYRLPSASEWEYAARAGATTPRPWTDPQMACRYANVADQTAGHRYPGWSVLSCSDGFAQTSPVGSFAANGFGLYDTLGNVFQWVQDCWSDDYQGAPSDGSARSDGDCAQHELRGGSWFSRPDYVRLSYRNRFPANYRSTTVGFRLIRELAP